MTELEAIFGYNAGLELISGFNIKLEAISSCRTRARARTSMEKMEGKSRINSWLSISERKGN